jgi:hypoxanthine phosphoribosyltransferase
VIFNPSISRLLACRKRGLTGSSGESNNIRSADKDRFARPLRVEHTLLTMRAHRSELSHFSLTIFPGTPTVKVLLSEVELNAGVRRLADQIHQQYDGKPLTIVGIMMGSFILLADLIRQLSMPLRVGVIQTSSYRGTERGSLTINSDLMPDIGGRDVLLIDDIFDTGHTLTKVIERMRELNPRSIRSAVLLLKTGRQEVTGRPDFVAFEIPDEFVVGYGLDYDDAYRNLPYLACLQEEDLNQHRAQT